MDKNIEINDGGGFVPPGMLAKAVPVVAARRAAERARVRKVRDIGEAPERRCAASSVTKVWQIGIGELPECKCLKGESVSSMATCQFPDRARHRPCSSRYFSASSAAAHPEPAAVIAWR